MSAPLAAWVAASFAVHAGVAILQDAALVRTLRGELVSVPDRAAVALLRWLLRVAFYVGVPYAALLSGTATPAQFALVMPDAEQTGVLLIPSALVLTGGVLAVSALARFARSRYPADVRPAVRRRAQIAQPWGVSFLLLDALCLQAHWTFYRAGVSLALPALTVWGGLALVIAEWVLDPAWRAGLRAPGLWEDQALLLVLAAFSAYLSALGVGFWLSLCAHAVLWVTWLSVLHYACRVPLEGRIG